MNILASAAATVIAIGTIGGGYAWVDTTYTKRQEFIQHVAQSRTGTIIDLMGRIKATDQGPLRDTYCKQIVFEFTQLCTEAPDSPLCLDRRAILNELGC
jgi:hypothetical protein